jgi:hypothetical protein
MSGGLERGFATFHVRNPRTKQRPCIDTMIVLVAPTRVSPASAAEQKQHHKNNQYGFHMLYSDSLR